MAEQKQESKSSAAIGSIVPFGLFFLGLFWVGSVITHSPKRRSFRGLPEQHETAVDDLLLLFNQVLSMPDTHPSSRSRRLSFARRVLTRADQEGSWLSGSVKEQLSKSWSRLSAELRK